MHPKPDLCHISIDILSQRCLLWFQQRQIAGPVWFADGSLPFPINNNEETVNVVLFGSFVRRVCTSQLWTASHVKLWVLSRSCRQVLSQVLNYPEDQIGIIPRYELFPIFGAQPSFPDFKKPTSLVFAGRLSPTKNIEALVWTNWYLQTEWQQLVELFLIGDFDNQSHPELGRGPVVNYQQKIHSLIESLNWKVKPRVIAKLGPLDWLRLDFVSPVFVSFTTFLCEDFGVSLAQTQAQGWPALVSDWGGHRDAVGRAIRKLPVHYIGRSNDSEALLQLKSRHLAARLQRPLAQAATPSELAITPQPTTQSQLADWRARTIRDLGPDLQRLQDGGIPAFAETRAGQKLLAHYRLAFAGEAEDHWSIILHGTAHVQAQALLQTAIDQKENAVFVTQQELSQRDRQWTVARSSQVFQVGPPR